jgi:arsenate reductase (glutaredoxin)
VYELALTVYEYPKCGTCRNAKKWLDENNVAFQSIHIVEEPPSEDVLVDLIQKSGLPIKKFFNTSGKRYRELGLKDKIPTASDEELVKILASDGMLIKRPIVTNGKQVTVGFNEELFVKTWKAV